MASLNTFGAILSYAIELENQLAEYYQALGNEERAKAAEKRKSKLERVRRENVLEITLEAIDGLDESNYALDLGDTSQTGQNAVEAIAVRFYQDVAPEINVRQAQRALEGCAKEHASYL